jgi:hypothetical protein
MNSVCASQESHYVILTRLHTGKRQISLLYHIYEFSLYLTGITLRHSNPPPHGEE